MGVRLLAREIVEAIFAEAWGESTSSLFRVISKRSKPVAYSVGGERDGG